MSKTSTSINQKAYLQKYLGGPSGDKKKKKKKAVKGTGLKIIDDDIDLSKLRTLDGDELDVFDQGEDAPQIAGIIDDRPEEVKKAEQFGSSSKWKIINQDDGFNSKLEVEEIKTDIKQSEKDNEFIFGKMYSDSEDEEKNDSDLSPPRKQDTDDKVKAPKSSKKHNSDSDISPPRKRDVRSPNLKDYDRSPKRRDDGFKRNHNDRSPNDRHINSAKRRDDRSPNERHDSLAKRRDNRSSNDRYDSSAKRSDDRSPKERHGNSAKRRDDRSPNNRHDNSAKRRDDKSPNERHYNSAMRRDDRSKNRSDDKRKSYDKSPKIRDDRSPNERQDKSIKRREDRSPNDRHDKSTKRSDEKRKNDDKSPKRKSDDKSPKISRDRSSKRKNADKSPKRRNDDKSPIKEKSRNERNEPPKPEKPRERVRKPSRWGVFGPEDPATLQPSTSEHSPNTVEANNSSPSRKSRTALSPRKSKNYDSSPSPPRKSKKNYDSDQSPPRKSKKSHDSPPTKSKKYSSSDASPPRKSKGDGRKRNESPEFLSPSKKLRYSPQRQSLKDKHERYQSNPRYDKPRKQRHSSDSDLSPPRRNRSDKSVSPPRKNRQLLENKRKFNSDSDQSPPRREKDRDTSERDRSKRGNDSPPPSNKRMAKTLEGKMAGLQDARQLRQENESFRKREEEVFNKMTDDVSGRNAQVVSRKSKRETSEERLKLKEKAERQKELDEKYMKWTKGIKQLEDQEARVQEFIHESSKPLARFKDDRDLEDNLRQVERAGDPMLKYMRDRKRERGELGPEKPIYKGQFPPNRFNIRPGYRWDGVDRSNGYENKYFDQQSKRKAQEEEAYKWSTEDL